MRFIVCAGTPQFVIKNGDMPTSVVRNKTFEKRKGENFILTFALTYHLFFKYGRLFWAVPHDFRQGGISLPILIKGKYFLPDIGIQDNQQRHHLNNNYLSGLVPRYFFHLCSAFSPYKVDETEKLNFKVWIQVALC